jgi:hypothetical protein
LLDALPPYPNDESLSVGEDESDSAQEGPAAKVDMGDSGSRKRDPDIKEEADDEGKVAKKHAPASRPKPLVAAKPAVIVRHAPPAAVQPEVHNNLFQRLFNSNRKQSNQAPTPSQGGN